MLLVLFQYQDDKDIFCTLKYLITFLNDVLYQLRSALILDLLIKVLLLFAVLCGDIRLRIGHLIHFLDRRITKKYKLSYTELDVQCIKFQKNLLKEAEYSPLENALGGLVLHAGVLVPALVRSCAVPGHRPGDAVGSLPLVRVVDGCRLLREKNSNSISNLKIIE